MSRFDGLLMLAMHVGYAVYPVLAATRHDAPDPYRRVLVSGMLPVIGVLLAGMLVKGWLAKRRRVAVG